MELCSMGRNDDRFWLTQLHFASACQVFLQTNDVLGATVENLSKLSLLYACFDENSLIHG